MSSVLIFDQKKDKCVPGERIVSRTMIGHTLHHHWILINILLKNKQEQAGAELGQAQRKLGLEFTLIFFRIGPIVLVELN